MFQFAQPPLASLTFRTGVTSIGNGEFQYSTLTNVTFLGPIKAIPNGAFHLSRDLVSVAYPDTVTSIGDEAFSNCANLREISLPAGLTRIGSAVFWFCSNLKPNMGRPVIPVNVTTIGELAFRGCNLWTQGFSGIEPGAGLVSGARL